MIWNWITTWVFWRCIGTFGILVLDSCVGILTLYWWMKFVLSFLGKLQRNIDVGFSSYTSFSYV